MDSAPVWRPRPVARSLIVGAPRVANACLPEAGQYGRVSDCKADNSFGRHKRLLNARDFSRVFDAPDARASHRYLLLLARRNSGGCHRFGLVIAKKNVRGAVDRNRLKRLAREFFRQQSTTGPGLDVVILARRDLGKLDNKEVSTILQQQWQKLMRHTCNSTFRHSRDP